MVNITSSIVKYVNRYVVVVDERFEPHRENTDRFAGNIEEEYDRTMFENSTMAFCRVSSFHKVLILIFFPKSAVHVQYY